MFSINGRLYVVGHACRTLSRFHQAGLGLADDMVFDSHFSHQGYGAGNIGLLVIETSQCCLDLIGVGRRVVLFYPVCCCKFSQVAGNVGIECRPLLNQFALTDYAAFAGHGSKLRAVDGDQFATNELFAPAKTNKSSAGCGEGRTIVPAKVGNGLKVRGQSLQEPEYFNVAVAFFL